MSITVTLPKDFQFVGAALGSTAWLLFMHYRITKVKRAKAGIEYPQAYATKEQEENSLDARIFNCAQRAHQNTLEHLPNVFVTTIIAGLSFPKTAAVGALLWTIGRVSYTQGYVTGDPKKRVSKLYSIGSVAMLGNFLLSSYQTVYWVYDGVAAYL
ncbi:hypothetical protein BKA70DRAFT_1250951 [Coprinopsis sp. MPI-PUGE-AT-0042]|nr:hypothetical protein BKA70DRAFT_1250951 [Coprinopsis sp. MPI-PUGE-AT-0042]